MSHKYQCNLITVNQLLYLEDCIRYRPEVHRNSANQTEWPAVVDPEPRITTSEFTSANRIVIALHRFSQSGNIPVMRGKMPSYLLDFFTRR